MDAPLKIGETEARLVLMGNKADIALDGKYLGSGKEYVPLKGIPLWSWIFIIACAAIVIFEKRKAYTRFAKRKKRFGVGL